MLEGAIGNLTRNAGSGERQGVSGEIDGYSGGISLGTRETDADEFSVRVIPDATETHDRACVALSSSSSSSSS